VKLINSLETLKDRFYSKVKKTYSCWNWIGGKDKNNCGKFLINRKTYRANRASWQIHKSKIPENLFVLHKCDNPSCVRPSHLFLGTQKDNMRDMVLKGRTVNQRGENNRRAKLTEDKVRKIRELYAKRTVNQKVLAKLFNISYQHISNIVNKKRWKHI